jgi:hypothetical protein
LIDGKRVFASARANIRGLFSSVPGSWNVPIPDISFYGEYPADLSIEDRIETKATYPWAAEAALALQSVSEEIYSDRETYISQTGIPP